MHPTFWALEGRGADRDPPPTQARKPEAWVEEHCWTAVSTSGQGCRGGSHLPGAGRASWRRGRLSAHWLRWSQLGKVFAICLERDVCTAHPRRVLGTTQGGGCTEGGRSKVTEEADSLRAREAQRLAGDWLVLVRCLERQRPEGRPRSRQWQRSEPSCGTQACGGLGTADLQDRADRLRADSAAASQALLGRQERQNKAEEAAPWPRALSEEQTLFFPREGLHLPVPRSSPRV